MSSSVLFGLKKLMLLGVMVLALLAQVACAPSAPASTGVPTNQQQSAAPAPRLIPANCPMPLKDAFVQGKNVECSYLVVKEDRAHANGRDLLLPIARFRANDANAAPDPIIMLQGGPGGSVLRDFSLFVPDAVRQALGKRDIILMEQRGTGYSSAPMRCDEERDVQYAQIQQNLPEAEALRQQDEGTKACRARLSQQLHLNLDAYTTLTNANDVHDLIMSLNLPQVNIYGVSYGTRLALEVMRSFPQRVRSVILDSSVPAQTDFPQNSPTVFARVFHRMFDDCAAQIACALKHPMLEQRFWSFISDTQKKPLILRLQDPNTQKVYEKAVFNGTTTAGIFWNLFYVTKFIPAIPVLMEEVMQGKYDTFTQIAESLTFDDSVNVGMYHSVTCNENGNRLSRTEIEGQAGQVDPSIRQDYTLSTEDFIQQCQIWNVKPERADLQQAVKSSLPTLIMEGAYDPITPPSYGQEAAKTLSKGYQFLAPSTGHGVFLSEQSCPLQVGAAFFQSPERAPDMSCAKQMPATPEFK